MSSTENGAGEHTQSNFVMNMPQTILVEKKRVELVWIAAMKYSIMLICWSEGEELLTLFLQTHEDCCREKGNYNKNISSL